MSGVTGPAVEAHAFGVTDAAKKVRFFNLLFMEYRAAHQEANSPTGKAANRLFQDVLKAKSDSVFAKLQAKVDRKGKIGLRLLAKLLFPTPTCPNCGKHFNHLKFSLAHPNEGLCCSSTCTFTFFYGASNPSKVEKIKSKKVASFIKRYSVHNPSLADEVKRKREQTNLDRRGVPSPFHDPFVQAACVASHKQRTGFSNPMQNPVTKEKARETNTERYGYANPMQNTEVLLRCLASNYKTHRMVHQGVSYTYQGYEGQVIKSCVKQGLLVMTQFDKNFPSQIYTCSGTMPDLYLPEHGVYIEVKSTYTLFGTSNSTRLSINKKKAFSMKSSGFHCIWVVADGRNRWIQLPRNWWQLTRENLQSLVYEKLSTKLNRTDTTNCQKY